MKGVEIMRNDNKGYIEYIQADKCWHFLKHTFLRFQSDPLFVNKVIIDGVEHKAIRCYGSPPLVIQIEGEYEFKDLNVGFIMPPDEEQYDRINNILEEVDKMNSKYDIKIRH